MQEETINKPEEIQEVNSITGTESPSGKVAQPKHPFFVFTVNTVLGLVLLAGLIVLYVIVLSRKEAPVQLPASVQSTAGKNIRMVYLNLDSLNDKYELVKAMRRDLEGTVGRLQGELKKDEEGLKKDGADLQQKVQSKLISEEKAAQIYEILMKRQQDLLEKRDRYTQMMTQMQMNMNQKLSDSLASYLKRFNSTYRFDFIMGYKTEGEILVANDSLDISRSIIEGLNKEYLEKKK
jgi:outer membrane protein